MAYKKAIVFKIKIFRYFSSTNSAYAGNFYLDGGYVCRHTQIAMASQNLDGRALMFAFSLAILPRSLRSDQLWLSKYVDATNHRQTLRLNFELYVALLQYN